VPKTNGIEGITLTGHKDIFKSTVKSFIKTDGENIVEIALEELHPPDFHPFHVNDDEAMERLTANIKQHGVREPGLARPRAGGGYELLAGNRRKRACELAELSAMPVIIREMSDADAVIAMVDSNLEQRETLLFSEKAWAYKVKMEALNHNGIKGEMHSVEVLVQQTGQSKNQIFRLIRLTELICTLLDLVDTRQLAFNPAVELSYLSQAEQTAVAKAMENHATKPSLSQAVRLKKLKQSGELTIELIDIILAEVKKPAPGEPKGSERYRRFFPPDYSTKQIEDVITSLLKGWQSEQSRTKEIATAI
jgi:ParB family chromosome partitioning protein